MTQVPVDDHDPTSCPDGSIVVDRTPTGISFRPSYGRTTRTVCLLVVLSGAIPMVLLAFVIMMEPTWATSPGGVVSLATMSLVISITMAFAAKRCRSSSETPLLVEPGGRVSYGSQILLDVGAKPRFTIETHWMDAESGHSLTYQVVASNRWGPVVRFPSPWFHEFSNRSVAIWFAQQLAQALDSEVENP